jgi:hypothetical protein
MRFYKPPKKEVARCQITRPRWPILIAIAWDDTNRKFFSQQHICFPRSVTDCAILLETLPFHTNTIQLRPQKLRYHVAIMYAILCYCTSGLIFVKVPTNNTASPKSAPNSGSLCMRWLLMNHSKIPRAPNSIVLCVQAHIKLNAHIIAKDDFLRKIAAHIWPSNKHLTNSPRCTRSVDLSSFVS